MLGALFPGGSEVKSICLQCGRPGFNPWVGKISWRRKWQSTPVFLPGESHGRRSLVGYSPRARKESDTTERLCFACCCLYGIVGLNTCINANYHQMAIAATASQALVGNSGSWAAGGGTGLNQGRGVACPWRICLDQGTGASRFSAVWTPGLKYHYSHHLETGRTDTRPGPREGEPAPETFLAPVPRIQALGRKERIRC